jgi:putative transposase
MGATPEGKKELVALSDGLRIRAVVQRGVARFEAARSEDRSQAGNWPTVRSGSGKRYRRCLARRARSDAGCTRRRTCSTSCPRICKPTRIRLAPDLAATRERATPPSITSCKATSPSIRKAAQCLPKDKDPLPSFYDFPAEHWHHIRTNNPIESTFASVRLRTAKTRGCGSRASISSTVFKLSQSAEQRWLKLRRAELIAKVITVQFKNGVEVQQNVRQEIAA